MTKSPMRAGLALAVALAVSPTGTGSGVRAESTAQPAGAPSGIVRLTAGEHGDFSRVVFALGGGLSYRAEPERAGFRIVFPDALVGFEYDDVYPKRRAHRVIMAEPALGAEGASLRLRFGCDCGVRTFTLGEKLVVDVYDTGSLAPEPERPAPAPPADALSAASGSRPGGAGEVGTQPAARNTFADASAGGQPRPEFLRRVESLSSPEPRLARPGAAPDGAAFDPEQVRRMLAWAIDHGHLTGAAQIEDGAPAPRSHAAGAPVPAAAEPAAPTPDEPGSPGSPGPPERQAAAADTEDRLCPGALALDMAVLGGGGTFAAELARRQDALSRALAADQGVPEAQHALAGFYLARLMPQEALGVLRGIVDRDKGGDPTPAWLEAAALVLADRASELPADALRGASCASADAALWRAVVIAARGPAPQELLESDVIPLRLATYPPELRVELGLRLADAGIATAAPAAMAQLLDLVEAAAPADEARARLLFLRGRLAAARGDFAGARASWQGALNLPGEGGLRATLALLEGDLAHDRLDEAAALSALERLTYDWRGHPAQLDIARLSAAIHERRGSLTEALGALEELALSAAGERNGRAAARLATDLMRRAYADASAAPPVDQLAAFWRYEGFVPPGPEGADVRLAFARTLITQGLPGPAIRLLEPVARGASGPAVDQAIDLLAAGYLAINQPSKTLDLLRTAAAGATEPKADRNRLAARALAALGRFAEAAGLLHGAAGDDTAQLQADYLWKAGLWRDAALAYRQLLEGGRAADQAAGSRSAIRLAAAAYMAKQPGLAGRSTELVSASGAASAASAFAPLPAPGSAADGTTARQLLEQARALGALAEQYDLSGPQSQ